MTPDFNPIISGANRELVMDRPVDPAPYIDPYGLFDATLYVGYDGTVRGKGVTATFLYGLGTGLEYDAGGADKGWYEDGIAEEALDDKGW